MKLYLVQHGEPIPEEENPERPLSDKGRSDCMKVAEKARDIGVRVGAIHHSEKLRAKQTAEVFQPYVMEDKEITETEGLKPMDNVEFWPGKIKEMEDDVMIVGHLPFLEKLSGLLVCDDENNKAVKFHQGGLVCLEMDDSGDWVVDYSILPDFFYIS